MPIQDLNLITVRGAFVLLDGTAASGTVTFESSVIITDPTTKQIVMPVKITATLNNGSFSISLPATNDPDFTPTGFTYKVTENITGATGRTYYINVPYDATGGIDLADVAPAGTPPSSGDVSYATVAYVNTQLNTKVSSTLVGAANGVAPLGSDGKVPASYLPVGGGGSGSSFSAGALSSRPAANVNSNIFYLATDTNGGTLYHSDGSAWSQVAAGVSVTGGSGAAFASGTLAARPNANTSSNEFYFATDDNGGTLYHTNGTTWTKVGKGLTEAPQAHASTHASGGSDAVTLAMSQITGLSTALAGKEPNLTTGTMSGRPTAATFGIGYYFATDSNGGQLYHSDGSAWTAMARGVSEAILKSTLTAKGSVLVSSASATPTELAAGADDTIPVFDSANSIGIRAGTMTKATFSVTGGLTATTYTMRYYVERAQTIKNVRASVGTPPQGASLIVDVKKNGTSIYNTTTSNRPTIAAGANTALGGAPDTTALAQGDYLTIQVVQVGSTTAGSDLTVQVQAT